MDAGSGAHRREREAVNAPPNDGTCANLPVDARAAIKVAIATVSTLFCQSERACPAYTHTQIAS